MTPTAKPEIVLATQNPGKIAELRQLLAETGVAVLGLADLGDIPPEPEETGSTFLENATIKAVAYARATGRLCLADDSGLEVDALGGRPGVISSHFAFDGRTDGEAAGLTREQRDDRNNARLLADLEGVPPEARTARFVCVMVLAGAGTPDGAEGVPPSVRAKPDPYTGHFVQHEGGRLPHWDKGGSTCFLTFRTAPQRMLSALEREVVLSACRHWHGVRYWLHTACVMPDHVHLLFRTIQQPDDSWPTIAEIVHSIKSFTAHKCRSSDQAGQTMWQREYFDRLVRNEQELDEANRYIQKNPVEAGLVGKAMEYPFLWRQDTFAEQLGLRPNGGRDAPRSIQILKATRGTFEGRIGLPGEVPRGPGGFGYDPLFLVAPGFQRTSAELGKEEKNRLSHRGHAVRAMVEYLQGMS